MTDSYLARWLRHADRDLHVAENELHTLTGDIITEAVCFHAQQAIEKYLKGYLVARQIKFPRTHNLNEPIALPRSEARNSGRQAVSG